jgi:general secretion pathway protein I
MSLSLPTGSISVRTMRRVRRARPAPVTPAATLSGFTLLEVMVAVAILGITLVSIFSSEAGAIRMAGRARLLTTATLLARCKMGELEEEFMRTGLPAVSSRGADECCEGGEVEGFDCEWEVSRVVIPDQMPLGEGDEEEGGAGGVLGGLLGGGADAPAGGAPPAPPNPAELLSGSLMAGGGNMISQLAMQFVLPTLKPIIEEQIRRATVTVRWHEGEGTQEFDVVQYVVAEQLNAAQMQAVTGGGQPPQQQSPQQQPPQRKP